MEMILMILLLHWKPDLDGSPNSQRFYAKILEKQKAEGVERKLGGI